MWKSRAVQWEFWKQLFLRIRHLGWWWPISGVGSARIFKHDTVCDPWLGTPSGSLPAQPPKAGMGKQLLPCFSCNTSVVRTWVWELGQRVWDCWHVSFCVDFVLGSWCLLALRMSLCVSRTLGLQGSVCSCALSFGAPGVQPHRLMAQPYSKASLRENPLPKVPGFGRLFHPLWPCLKLCSLSVSELLLFPLYLCS